jgi:2-polyprenyl-6-methoxyphenol hydroxylase-like FAD-dependent oxidoreductase
VTILVVGGGIAGLATAIGLRRQGIDAQVYERASALREIGAGLSLWRNAPGRARCAGSR